MTKPYNARAVAGLIAHTGSMCLLDRVIEHDAEHIVCRVISHRDHDHPLRHGDRLPSTAAIEYGAQAMAAHGALGAMSVAGSSRALASPGMLAAARGIKFSVARLDDLAGDLTVTARALARQSDGLIYDFSIDCDGAAIASGRLTVMLLR